MFTWEFNGCLDSNTPIDVGRRSNWHRRRQPFERDLDNGNLQQPCQRYVGGPESLFPTIMYASMYGDFFLKR